MLFFFNNRSYLLSLFLKLLNLFFLDIRNFVFLYLISLCSFLWDRIFNNKWCEIVLIQTYNSLNYTTISLRNNIRKRLNMRIIWWKKIFLIIWIHVDFLFSTFMFEILVFDCIIDGLKIFCWSVLILRIFDELFDIVLKLYFNEFFRLFDSCFH